MMVYKCWTRFTSKIYIFIIIKHIKSFIHNDASGNITTSDAGASFPANNTSGVLTTIYSIQLYNAPNSDTVYFSIINKELQIEATYSTSTNLPSLTTGLNFFACRCMAGSGGLTNTGQFDISILGVYSI